MHYKNIATLNHKLNLALIILIHELWIICVYILNDAGSHVSVSVVIYYYYNNIIIVMYSNIA